MKTCTKCGETKPLEDFHRMTKSTDGRRSSCKTCTREAHVKRRAERGEEARAKERERERRRRLGLTKPKPAFTTLCHYPKCRKTAAHDSGLCTPHHVELAASTESPLALTGGRWVKDRMGVRRWVA